MSAMKANAKLADRFMKLALTYPEAWEDDPWGDTVVKVRKKIFLFCGVHEVDGRTVLGVTVKLPDSREFALSFGWTEPTGYGMGRAGWVSCRFPLRSDVPIDLVEEWIDESYRAIAPKTLVKQLDG
jgi:predicted DNA-binding protein (MmcQ/YjbR family)